MDSNVSQVRVNELRRFRVALRKVKVMFLLFHRTVIHSYTGVLDAHHCWYDIRVCDLDTAIVPKSQQVQEIQHYH